MMIPTPQNTPFSGLRLLAVFGYSFSAVAKSAAGRRNPSYFKATPDAPGVFFYVVVQAHPFSGLWCLHRGPCQIMVARAGQPSGWPVSLKAGIPTPVRVTTHERRNSGGGNNRYFKEVAIMATILTPSHPQFVFVFAAVRRADRHSPICMLRTVADSERSARRSLAREYVLSFAGRLPVTGVCA
ncbi:host cell division inhibitor Icd-like protein [Edwardsiella tarda]|uniref:host cell division inhibitor Icd-like protein n=1 Tax=Edwardsiella tarda TaxID=636 RepID=UPI000BE43CD6|nr:host cell division inhibitor Icd-like protein [Edwardsiella tarda]ATI64847.1 Ash-like/host cell division inhibitor Icd-like protein [Edwardsiella tarda]